MPDELTLAPMDSHNQALLRNAHPAGWTNPEPTGRYNMVVIGAGTAGLVTAAGAAGLGAKVALVERRLMGGDCLNYGCVPSKCMIRSARQVRAVRDSERLGVRAGGEPQVDFAAVMERMRRLRSRISENDSAQRFRDMGIDVYLGEGVFTGPDCVEVDGRTLRFARACIATGARPAIPVIAGLTEADCLTNETVFSLTELPPRLVVMGGGPIGCELGQAFARLGSQVTIIQKRGQLLPREAPEVAGILARSLERDGAGVLLNCNVARVSRAGDDKVVHFVSAGEQHQLAADAILLAVGRTPNVEGLGLEAAGVAYDARTGVTVDDRLRTTNRRIYAAGDVCMRRKFTHAADAAARIVIQNALFWGRKKLSSLTIPWCTYTDPEIAHVGASEAEAAEMGVETEAFTQRFADVDRAIADGEEEGLAAIHVGKGSGKILGATIVASHAGEMINEITLAMVAGVGLGALAGVIHPYPTQAEAIKRLADAYNRTRLTPRVKRLFTRLLAWRR